jgi:hypothetical protein
MTIAIDSGKNRLMTGAICFPPKKYEGVASKQTASGVLFLANKLS